MAVVKKKAAKKVAAKSKAKPIKTKAVKVTAKIKAQPSAAAAKKIGAKINAKVKALVQSMKKPAKAKAPAKKKKAEIITGIETIKGISNPYLVVVKASSAGAKKYKDLKIGVRIGSGGVRIHAHPAKTDSSGLFHGGVGKPFVSGEGRYVSRSVDKEEFAKLFKEWKVNTDVATLPEALIVKYFKGEVGGSESADA